MLGRLQNLLSQARSFAQQNPLVATLGGIALAVVFFLLFLRGGPQKSRQAPPPPGMQISPVGPQEYEKALVDRYEKQFDELKKRVDTQSQQQEKAEKELSQVREIIGKMSQDLQKGLEGLRQSLERRETRQELPSPTSPGVQPLRRITPGQERGAGPSATGRPTTTQKSAQKEEETPTNFVELPAGSFVQSTLLTGVYAPADVSNPLPVLVSINEGFTGPNHSRIPLQGCFALGKAAAELGAERATIQIATLSCVLPSGEVFERDVSGYVAGADGSFGVAGKVIRRDTKKIAMAAVTGFLSGAAKALSDLERTTTVSGSAGTITSAVTGNAVQFTAFSGLSETANQLAQYYINLARQITPVIEVRNGLDINVVMNRGITIEGLSADSLRVEPVRYSPAHR